jgi:hypothetical protein
MAENITDDRFGGIILRVLAQIRKSLNPAFDTTQLLLPKRLNPAAPLAPDHIIESLVILPTDQISVVEYFLDNQ